MTGQLRSELLKLRTTRTTLTLIISMLGLIAVVVSIHAFGLPADQLRQAANEPKVFGWGTTIGSLFAALFGAIAVTGEFRHGTIRPTLLASPHRRRVLAAKALTAAAAGAATGLVSTTLVVALGRVGFAARDIPVALSGHDFVQLVVGGTAAAALWGAIGAGVGAVVRAQVGAVVGLCVWLLLVENILIGIMPKAARFAPAATGGALAGMVPNADASTLLAPAVGALLLVAYVALTTTVAAVAIERRDID